MMDNKKQLVQLIKSISGQSNLITIPRVFIDITDGDLNAAVLLSQVVYWSDKSTRDDGWFYKSYPEWRDEIGLTQFQVKRASDKLVGMGLLETKLKRAQNAPTLHYKLDFLLLTNLIIKKLDNRETELSDYEESQESDYQETQQTLTETTHQTTTKNSSNGAKAPKRTRDERLDHPAIVAYKEEARLNVPINWRDDVIKTVLDTARWRELVHEWVGHGWNKGNISGMLEAYKAGGIRKNGKPSASPQDDDMFDRLAAEGKQERKIF